MQESIMVIDCQGHSLIAKCTSFGWDHYSWQVQFWGPRGLRYSAPIRVDPGATLEQSLQQYVQDNCLIAVIEIPKQPGHLPPLL